MGTPLSAGYSTIINQKVGSTSTPLYPFTKTANVIDANGNNVDELIAGRAPASHGNHVPTVEAEASNLRFLRNDNTWAAVQSASTSQAGVVQLVSDYATNDNTKAASAGALYSLAEVVSGITGDLSDYVLKSQLGVPTTTVEQVTTVGVATLGTDGKVPSSQLPSFVDDVVDAYYHETEVEDPDTHVVSTVGKMYSDAEFQNEITPESGKIYIDLPTNLTYRWSGTVYVKIASSLALGTTENTAFRGDYGNAAYQHSLADHARTDATKTEASEQNGYIKINGTETLVYTHPTGATATNPHGTTAADVGLGNVENKSSETIRSEITSSNVTTALGYTPQNAATLATAAQNGVMSSAYAAKLDNCLEASVGQTAPTFQGTGIWFQVIPDTTPEEPEEEPKEP